ncbi:pseudouridylate synthase RPUSD4, mitochondrial-like [Antedon mediterranea]|uniref:pseudouridylate synthase RPUSD4, mitochondrial-like n=1 Tax=Antedon mediterranea TaxID=105859 RepID=UPI003AF6ACF1
MNLFCNFRVFIRLNSHINSCVFSRCLSTGDVVFVPRKLPFRVPKETFSEGQDPFVRSTNKPQNNGNQESSDSNIFSYSNISTHDLKINDNLPDVGGIEENENTIYIQFDGTEKKNRKDAEKQKASELSPAKAAAMNVRDSLRSETVTSSKNTGFDSKGFKIYTDTVPDLKRVPPAKVTSILKSRIIYNEGEILAIDKPYGLPCHGGPGVVNNIEELLPRLARMLPGQQEDLTLHMVHRLDKETTGVMLFAKTEEMKLKLQAMFRNHVISKKYWVITVGVPEPNKGMLDIPMIEKEVEGKHRMSLKPDIGDVYKNLWQKKSRSFGTKAVSKFRVLDDNGTAALVEVQAVTGVKHQVRCHMAFGLGCPILGDHKYSHFNKIAPQKLPVEMLQRFRLRQAKVRTMPMHLHAHQIFLPEIYQGRNLSITTRLPQFFNKNLSYLKLKVS